MVEPRHPADQGPRLRRVPFLKGPEYEDYTLYSSHTARQSQATLKAWDPSRKRSVSPIGTLGKTSRCTSTIRNSKALRSARPCVAAKMLSRSAVPAGSVLARQRFHRPPMAAGKGTIGGIGTKWARWRLMRAAWTLLLPWPRPRRRSLPPLSAASSRARSKPPARVPASCTTLS